MYACCILYNIIMSPLYYLYCCRLFSHFYDLVLQCFFLLIYFKETNKNDHIRSNILLTNIVMSKYCAVYSKLMVQCCSAECRGEYNNNIAG